ncbi:MAG: hypothetical protein GQ523_10550 [Methanophagales archaeon]|nr:hypothetical protein [Methanophagales archaeon]
MEKKTKLTITLALAVLVITLSLGTVISIAPVESGTPTAAPIQSEISAPIQPEIEAPIQPEIELPIQSEIEAPIQPEIEAPIQPEIVLTEAQFGACCAPTTCGVFYVTAPPHEAQTIYTASPLADRMLFTITCTNTEDIMTVSIPPLPNEVIRTGNSLTFYGQVTGDIKVWPSGSSSEARGFYCATIVKP